MRLQVAAATCALATIAALHAGMQDRIADRYVARTVRIRLALSAVAASKAAPAAALGIAFAFDADAQISTPQTG
jgi:hypothetical protein